jgi:hypothetical protein
MPSSSRSRRRLRLRDPEDATLRSFETTRNCPTSRCNTPEDSYLQPHRCENLKSRNTMRPDITVWGLWFSKPVDTDGVCDLWGCAAVGVSRRLRDEVKYVLLSRWERPLPLQRWWLVTFGWVAWLLGQGVVVLVNSYFMFCFPASYASCGTSAAVTVWHTALVPLTLWRRVIHIWVVPHN